MRFVAVVSRQYQAGNLNLVLSPQGKLFYTQGEEKDGRAGRNDYAAKGRFYEIPIHAIE